MNKNAIFISYRRTDAAHFAGRLYDHLMPVLGEELLFMDIDRLRPGENFRRKLEQTLDQCQIMLVVMGERWTTGGNPDRPAIQSEQDWPRIEVEAALKRGVIVIPVTVDETIVPSKKQLPTALYDLADIQAMRIRYTTFRRDAEELIKHIKGYLENVSASEPSVWALMQKDPQVATTRYLESTVGIKSKKGGVELVRISAGSFLMGSATGGFGDERPQHEVTVSSFYLGRYPVTNEEYGRFLAANPDATEPAHWSDGQFNQARQPVVGVNWEDAKQFAEWAGGRLPTEAEWEYAARAGTQTQWSFGDDGEKLGDYAWYGENSDGTTHPVGQKNPNPFSLYDVHGNAYEWAEDCWHENYESAPKDGSAWLEADEGNCALRVIRGGSWNNRPVGLRSAHRYWFYAVNRFNSIGFRLAQDL